MRTLQTVFSSVLCVLFMIACESASGPSGDVSITADVSQPDTAGADINIQNDTVQIDTYVQVDTYVAPDTSFIDTGPSEDTTIVPDVIIDPLEAYYWIENDWQCIEGDIKGETRTVKIDSYDEVEEKVVIDEDYNLICEISYVRLNPEKSDTTNTVYDFWGTSKTGKTVCNGTIDKVEGKAIINYHKVATPDEISTLIFVIQD